VGNSSDSKSQQRAKKGALRESGEFEGFVRNPPSTGKTQPPSRGENVDPHGQQSPNSPMKPVVLQFPKATNSADLASFEIQKQPQSRSPYWFAKGN